MPALQHTIGQSDFEEMAIAAADEPRVRKHATLAREIVRALIAGLPLSGNVGELGLAAPTPSGVGPSSVSPDHLVVLLLANAGLDKPSIAPHARIISESIACWLVSWWCLNKSHATGVLERLRKIDHQIASGVRNWEIGKEKEKPCNTSTRTRFPRAK